MLDGSMVLMITLVIVAGAVGGAANAVISDNGFLLPRSEITAGGARLLRPGFVGNMFTGGVAAMVSWGLYGPLSSRVIVGPAEALAQNAAASTLGLTLASLVGAVLVGVGGARWLSNEVDKKLLKAAAVDAATKQSSPEASQKMALSTPAQTLNIARSMPAHQ